MNSLCAKNDPQYLMLPQYSATGTGTSEINRCAKCHFVITEGHLTVNICTFVNMARYECGANFR
jgi:hypothetical protein